MMVLPALPFFFEAEGKIIHITTMVLPNRFLAKNQDASILLMHGFIKKPLFPALHEMGRNLLGVMAGVFPEMKKHGHAPARIPAPSPVSKDTPKGR
jgi:hypothetical protein